MRNNKFIRAFFIVLILAVNIIYLYPVLSGISGHIAGQFYNSPDLNGPLWLHNWCYNNTRNLTFNYWGHTNLSFYPGGTSVYPIYYNLLLPYLTVPLRIVFGFPLYYNILILIIAALNVWSFYILAGRYTGDAITALLTSVIFNYTFVAFRFINMGQIDHLCVFPVVISVIYLFKYLEKGSLKFIAIAGALAGVAGAFYWFYLYLTCILAAIIAGWACYTRKMRFLKAAAGIILFIAVAAAVIFPFALPIIKSYNSGLSPTTLGLDKSKLLPTSSQVKALGQGALDSRFTYYIAESRDLAESFIPKRNNESYITSLLLLAAVLLLFFTGPLDRSKLLLLILSVFYYILSLGPFLKVKEQIIMSNGWVIPLPYYFIARYFPIFFRFAWPLRINVFVNIFLALTFISSLEKSSIFPGVLKKRLFAAFLALLLFAEMKYVTPRHIIMTRPDIPAFYYKLAGERDCAVIELPVLRSVKALAYQIIHNKPLLGGNNLQVPYIVPFSHVEFIRKNSFLQHLLLLDTNISAPGQYAYRKGDLEDLKRLHYKYLILNRLHCENHITTKSLLTYFNINLLFRDNPEKSYSVKYERNESGLHANNKYPDECYGKYLEFLETQFGPAVYGDGRIRVYRIP